MSENPEIGQFVQTGSYRTNVHVAGSGPAMLVLHGSGAGVCAWANWRTFIPAMQDRFQVIAPDLVGFGYTETPADFTFRFMDSLSLIHISEPPTLRRLSDAGFFLEKKISV